VYALITNNLDRRCAEDQPQKATSLSGGPQIIPCRASCGCCCGWSWTQPRSVQL